MRWPMNRIQLGTRRLQPQLFVMLLIAGLAGLGSSLIVPLAWGDRVRVPALHAAHASFRVPDGLDPVCASQTEPLACVLRNVKRLEAGPGDVILTAAAISTPETSALIASCSHMA